MMNEPNRYNDLGPLHDLLLRACPPDDEGHRSIMVLADKMGLSWQNLYKWIAGKRIPPKRVRQLVEIADGRVSQEDVLKFVL